MHYEYTPILLIIGFIFGFFFERIGHIGESFHYVSGISGHSLLLIFIPLLIFESAFNADTYVFMKSIWQIILLAFPAVVFNIGLISLSLMYILGYSSELNWGMAFSLSSILAATDPVAVVAILKSTGAKIKLNMVIEGESLMNDGSASIFFFVFADMILSNTFSFSGFMVKFSRLTLGGVTLGLLMGAITTPIMRALPNDILVVVFSFISAYVTFFLAESEMTGFHFSGILGVVVLGLYLGGTVRPRLNPHYLHTLHSIWQFGQFTMETLLFLLTGGYIGIFIGNGDFLISGLDVAKLFGFNFLVLIIRYLVLAIFWPLMNLVGYKITWKEYILIGWAGLRGVIGLAIGLLVSLNKTYPERFRDLTILYVSGVIIFTVLFQGMTLKLVMRLVGYNRMSFTKKKLYKDLRRRMFLNLLEKSENLRSNKEITYMVSWETIYSIFGFSKYILDIENLESSGKTLLLDYNYHHDTEALMESHVDKLDHMISDDEIDTYRGMDEFKKVNEYNTNENTFFDDDDSIVQNKSTLQINQDKSLNQIRIRGEYILLLFVLSLQGYTLIHI